MAGNGALDLSIRIMGKVDPSLKNAIGQTKNLTGSLGQALMGTKSLTSAVADTLGVIGKTGLAATAAFTTAATVGIKSCTDEAKKFEAQMAPVMRYVDGLADSAGKASEAMASNGQTFAQNYAEMKDYIQDLSRDIPRSTEQLTTMSAALGQSGKGFSEQVSTGILRDTAVAATAMDLDDQTAGDYMAKWEVAFSKKDASGKTVNYSHDDVMRLMNQINYVAANSATTAPELAAAVNASASVGQLAGIDPSTTVALADAMLATGVNPSSVGTSIKRTYINLTKGKSASDTMEGAWNELGFTAEGVAKSAQEDGAGTLAKVFAAIRQLPKERQLATLNTLFGSWATEGTAKVTNNWDVYEKAFQMVNDPSAYSNSMEREFAINSGTAESIDIMKSNAKTALMQDAGDQFLPAYKELAKLQLDIYKDIDDNLPNLEQLVTSFMPLLRTAVEGIGGAIKTALPYAQKLIDAMAQDPGTTLRVIGGMVGLFAAMSAAPKVYGAASSVARAVGNFAIGGRSSGIPGGTLGGITVSNLLGALSPTSLFRNTVSGAGKLNTVVQGARRGAQMAATGTAQPTTLLGKVGQAVNGAGIGTWAALKNFKGLQRGSSKANLSFVKDVMGATESGGLLGILKGSPAGRYASRVGQSLSNLRSTKIGSGIIQAGGVAKQILSGIVGPQGIDVAGMFGRVKNFGGTAASVLAGLPGAAAGNIGKAGVGLLAKMNFANGTGLGRTIYRMANSTAGLSGQDALSQMGYIFGQTKPGKMLSGAKNAVVGGVTKVAGGAVGAVKNVGQFAGAGLNVIGTTVGPVAAKLGSGFMSLLGTFGPAITGIGTLIAAVSLLGDHFEDIRSIVQQVFGDGGLAIFDAFAGKIGGIAESIKTAFSPEGLLNIQQSLSGQSFFGIDLGEAFGAAMPVIESVVGVIQQIVDLGVNHIKPVLTEIISFVVNEGLPAVMPLLSTVISLVGTILVNAIKTVVDIVGTLLPIVEPVILGIIGLLKNIATVGVKVVNFIIRALNKIQLTIPETLFGIPIPLVGGKSFGFNLSEVSLPAFANGGFTEGPSIAGEAGTEAVISFRRSQRDQNVQTWLQAGRMLGVPAAAGLFLGSDVGLIFSRVTEVANYAADALESAAAAGDETAQKLVGNEKAQQAIGFIRKADVAQAELSYAASADGLDLSNITYFPTADDTALTLQNLQNLQGFRQEVELNLPAGTGSDSSVGVSPRGTGGEYSRTYTSSSGNTYVYAPNFTVYGSMNEDELHSIMEQGYERFCEYVERYEQEKRRRGYGT